MRARFVFRCAAAVWLGPAALLMADDRLVSVVREIEEHERLYANLEVRLRTHYDIGDRPPAQFTGGEEIVRKDFDTHFVIQNGHFRLETQGADVDARDRPVTRNKVRVYGGDKTRLLSGTSIGNIIEGRAEDDEFVRPHTLLLRYSSIPVPLSVYLGGTVAIGTAAGEKWLSGLELDIAYAGEEEWSGLSCHKVTVTTVMPGVVREPLTICCLWLARSRNCLPIRLLLWDLKVSKEIPRVEGSLGELAELEPGTWFPDGAKIVSFQAEPLQSEGMQKIGWQEEYFVESVTLAPEYEASYFTDLEFPEGTAVYEVADGKITKSYRAGPPTAPAHEAPGETPEAASVPTAAWWLVFASVAAAIMCAGTIVVRRRRAP